MVWEKEIFREREKKCCFYDLSYMHLYFCTSGTNCLPSWRLNSSIFRFSKHTLQIFCFRTIFFLYEFLEQRKITWSILNLYLFSDINESARGWAMNLNNEYQNFSIFIGLLIAGDEGWKTNFWYYPPHLSPATKLGNRAYRCGGNQA